jgi:hypothetical protein
MAAAGRKAAPANDPAMSVDALGTAAMSSRVEMATVVTAASANRRWRIGAGAGGTVERSAISVAPPLPGPRAG